MEYIKLLFSIAAFVFLGGIAQSSEKVALVIGNANYIHAAPLNNPENDARAISDKLRQLDFEVFHHENLTGQAFRIALGEFTEAALQSDIAWVFYAGHGIEMGGQNYLIPIDAKMEKESAARYEAIALHDLLSAVREAGKLGIVSLDACRDNPFASKMKRNNGTRSLSRGLAPVSVEEESGLLISFAAEAGDTAADGEGSHSPYTAALLQTIGTPGLEIETVFSKVFRKVLKDTNGKQRPIMTWQPATEEIYLVPASQPANNDTTANTTIVSQPLVAPKEDPLLVYLAAIQSDENTALEHFLRRWPEHPKAADARKILTARAEANFWEQTKSTNTERAYQTFILGFPNSRYSADANAKLDFFRKPKSVPKAAVDVTGPSCQDLWHQRNEIFHRRGYCFGSAKGKKYFSNANCTTKSPTLSSSENRTVKRIQTQERNLGC